MEKILPWNEKNWGAYNPHVIPFEELPFIYGFNNGGGNKCWQACLVAADGTPLGGHTCSNECFMPGDLGIMVDFGFNRHADFQKHYPHGYRLVFVRYDEVAGHTGLQEALKLNAKFGDDDG